ncbi:hypothetical protein ABZ650_30795 [Streptomyces griseoviridis]|uniref:hypothetical protein n=1 Tax=Streptomyces griseoviridis TaxID=45398 RepID=UPI0033DB0D45
MSERGTTGAVRTGGASDGRRGLAARTTGTRRTAGSLAWAVGLTAAMVLSAATAQWQTWIGVVLAMASVAVTACLVGGVWHRAGAATLASCAGFGLVLFAGPALYEIYMKSAGEPVPAVVTSVSERRGVRDTLRYCALRELGGERRTYEVSQTENCFGQAKAGDRVEIRVDPLGVLEPRLPDSTDSGGTTDITAGIGAGLALLTAATVLRAGLRRRAGHGG